MNYGRHTVSHRLSAAIICDIVFGRRDDGTRGEWKEVKIVRIFKRRLLRLNYDSPYY